MRASSWYGDKGSGSAHGLASRATSTCNLRLDAHFTQYVSKAASHILAYVESSMVHGITRSCRAVT
mgnify:CR=1 FL=1